MNPRQAAVSAARLNALQTCVPAASPPAAPPRVGHSLFENFTPQHGNSFVGCSLGTLPHYQRSVIRPPACAAGLKGRLHDDKGHGKPQTTHDRLSQSKKARLQRYIPSSNSGECDKLLQHAASACPPVLRRTQGCTTQMTCMSLGCSCSTPLLGLPTR